MDPNKLRQIKICFRQAMNADLSNSMREHGLQYKLNFGVPAPRIRLIAEQFDQEIETATYLWNEDVRESKMLATYLYPQSEMTYQTAMQWCEQIRYTEIADQVCMNLFVNLPYAFDLAEACVRSERPMVVYTGFRLLTRLALKGEYPATIASDSILSELKKSLLSETSYLRTVALNFAEKLADTDDVQRSKLSGSLADWKDSTDEKQRYLFSLICYWI